MRKKILLMQFRQDKFIAEHEISCFLCGLKIKKETLIIKNFFQTKQSAINIKDVKALIIGGSGEFSFSDKEKLPLLWEKTKKSFPLIKNIIEQGIPILGICFGHQLLAYLMGAKISNDKNQAETGTYKIYLNKSGKQDNLFQGLPKSFLAQEGHKDSVLNLPKKIQVLAKSKKCKIQAFRIGNVYGIQFHPEMDLKDVEFRLREYPDYAKNKKKITIKNSSLAKKLLLNFKKLI